MPAYNEAQHIFRNLREAVDTLHDLHLNFEIILVDDGSPDKTYLAAARLLVNEPDRVRIVRYETNQGKGGALVCGSSYARGDYIVFLDADMDLHPIQLPVLLEMMATNNADAVIGSKFHCGSRVTYPIMRRVYSMGYYGLIRVLFGLPLKDTQTGIKVFKSKVLQDVLPLVTTKGFAFDIELLARAYKQGYKLVDAPVTLNFQRQTNRVSFRDVWQVLRDTLRVFWMINVVQADPQMGDAHLVSREIRSDELPQMLEEATSA